MALFLSEPTAWEVDSFFAHACPIEPTSREVGSNTPESGRGSFANLYGGRGGRLSEAGSVKHAASADRWVHLPLPGALAKSQSMPTSRCAFVIVGIG